LALAEVSEDINSGKEVKGKEPPRGQIPSLKSIPLQHHQRSSEHDF
jgi:hypothetical protein